MLIKDITNHFESILGRGYVHEKPWALDLRHKLDNPSLVESASASSTGDISCSFTSRLSLPKESGSLSAEVNVDGSTVVTANYPIKFFRGFTLAAQASRSTKALPKRSGVELSADYKRDNLQSKLSLNPALHTYKACFSTFANVPRFDDEIPLKPDCVYAACEVEGRYASPTTLKCTYATSYAVQIRDRLLTNSLKLEPVGKSKLGKVTFGVSSKALRGLSSELAAKWAYNVPSETTELTFGGNWFLDPTTKQTMVKAKINQNGKVAAALTHKVSETVAFTIGGQLDATRKLTSSENTAKIGFKLSLVA